MLAGNERCDGAVVGSNPAKGTNKGPHGVVVETGHVTVSGGSADFIFTKVDASRRCFRLAAEPAEHRQRFSNPH